MIKLIPAIDIIEGKCVRLSQGDYNRKTIYNEDPLEVAKEFEHHGLTHLHLVDLDGAKAQHIVNWKVLEKIATHTGLVIDFGGGLKQNRDLEIAFECGAEMITGGSIAVKNREVFEQWIEQYGPEKIILGADVKEGKIAVNGWKEETNEALSPFLQHYIDKQINKVISTDIQRDGMLQGPAVDLYRQIKEEFPSLYLIASGGVSSIADLETLQQHGIEAVIFGKAIYEGRIKLNDLKPFL